MKRRVLPKRQLDRSLEQLIVGAQTHRHDVTRIDLENKIADHNADLIFGPGDQQTTHPQLCVVCTRDGQPGMERVESGWTGPDLRTTPHNHHIITGAL
jgi:hypothetical protein